MIFASVVFWTLVPLNLFLIVHAVKQYRRNETEVILTMTIFTIFMMLIGMTTQMIWGGGF